MKVDIHGIISMNLKCTCGYKGRISCAPFMDDFALNWQCPKCEKRFRIGTEIEFHPIQRMTGKIVKSNIE